ncbi:N-acetylmuramoyl-L-alanine amidase family protein [Tepidibacter hydrothermalis]|uniref:N-acetylmuramoyl-L-alanine amidase family protein n=1 Tax=Tepidibacter hydrothermalis TaxID=3036126 RepID=A0ABY8EDJ5_9FIRM|nr:N-acetylmuramoyl-L-alanine amidase family protein [Tepidibacter hydrothermalis]WFD11013.1 N-acetylmuramoyl-L-alanine amidase family protein [Tepidibacter hydrothermalis]
MRRLGSVFSLFLIVFCLLANLSYANEDVLEGSFVLDGKNVKLPITKVKLDGKYLKGDVPPVILNDRTLVPVRLVSENLGAKVIWDGKKYEVHIQKDDKEIVLKIDSYKAYVNGKEYTLPDKVPAKLISDRTMVPVRFVSEQLGVNVDWDASNRVVLLESQDDFTKVENIEYSLDEVKIKLSDKSTYKDMILVNPDRLIIDIQDSKMATPKDKYLVNGQIIKNIRVSQFSEEPMESRVVIDLNYMDEYDITQDDNIITIKFKIKDNYAKFEFEKDDKEEFKVSRDVKSRYKSFYLDGPNRFVIDLYYTKIYDDEQSVEKEINEEYVKSYRAYYYEDEHRTRLVLTLKEGIDRRNIKLTEDESDINILFDFLEVDIDNESLEYDFNSNNSLFKVTKKILDDESSEDVEEDIIEYDEWENKIKVNIDNKYIDLKDEEIEVNDYFVKSIEVDKKSDYTRINIYLKDDVIYKVLDEDDNSVKIKLYTEEETQRNGKYLVVIDAGHGGKDPGAVSPIDKTKEKDLTLQISKMLNEKLVQNGYDTIMTRTDDTYPELKARTEIANNKDADLFISIHINAVDKTDIHGIQTLYYPNNGEYANGRDNEALAKIIHKELINQTGAADRKMVKRPNLIVIKYTEMPAVLIECGFLTNSNELNLMKSQEYQDKLVDGIYKGVQKYFEGQQ